MSNQVKNCSKHESSYPLILNTICNSLLLLPQAGKILPKSGDPNYTKLESFWKNLHNILTIFDISLKRHFERGSACETNDS